MLYLPRKRLLIPGGKFHVEHYRRKLLLGVYDVINDVTTQGKNHALDVVFGAAAPLTQVATWYIGLINNTPTPTLAATDTLASHAGWSELVPATDYTGNRKAWNDADSAAGVKASSSVSTFAILTTQTVNGLFVCSAATGTSGTLWSTGAFDDVIPLVNGDDLKVTYSYTL